LNEVFVGKTPLKHKDTKIFSTTNYVCKDKEGYAPFKTSFSRDEEADVRPIIRGVFSWHLFYE
jgi:hypothetical protein